MQQIYNFEQHNPPIINENMLQKELGKRKINRQTTLIVIASMLLQAVIVMLGLSAFEWHPWITILCFGYVIISITGGSVIAITYTKKGGVTI